MPCRRNAPRRQLSQQPRIHAPGNRCDHESRFGSEQRLQGLAGENAPFPLHPRPFFGIAREQAGQAISVMEADSFNQAAIHDIAAVAALDHGFDAQDLALEVSCSDGSCTSPGAVATVHAQLNVSLPAVPGFVTANVATLTSDVTVVSGRYA